MTEVLHWLPVTALIAVLIFIAKELIEIRRRANSDERKRTAFKALLARECELNNWAIRSLRNITVELKEMQEPTFDQFRIEYAKSGRIYACLDSTNRGMFMKIAVPRVHKEQLEANLLEIATLDSSLFPLAEASLTAVAELEHLRESLLYHGLEDDDEVRDRAPDFAEYAVRQLEKSEAVLSALYKHCTGKELSNVRVR